ncbi:MAG: sugar transferase [Pseudomonadota bacterium]|nr:sugar transferase [Pseudomonadota bacterium]
MFERQGNERDLEPAETISEALPHGLDMPAYEAAPARERTADVARRPANSRLKRLFDLVLAVPALVITAPLLAITALIIWCADGGAPVFVQQRLGRDGKPFRFYKFRSMRVDAEARLQQRLHEDPQAAREWVDTRKLRHDPRITPFGAFIRTWSIDELPQLINVVRGDMSLVGPRPIVHAPGSELDDTRLYGADIAFYKMARPGLTGLWQVSGRADTAFAQRVAMDVDYVRRWSAALDIAIIVRTIPVILLRRGAF